MNKHTEGAWHTSFGKKLIRVQANGLTICGVHKIGKFTNNNRVSEEVKANALLIAAAPELLEALTSVV